ncbi:MAG: rRNA pseudouridine synthase [Candidatus Omnitrophota bacterium]|nr:MAG: rRNA pseudouridine synthase [Candidatus Omnitrophota bacterium]
MSPRIRLHKAIAQAGIASRRKAEKLIASGKVKVNGKIVKKQGVIVEPSRDAIEVLGGKISPFAKRKYYFLLNKPVGYVTTTKDPRRRKTVMELIPDIKGLFPVGRLDKNTTGLLLITNDGELAYRLTHPKFEIEKVYNAEVDGDITESELKKLEKGVYIDGKRTSPCKIKILNKAAVQLRIHEGRKRQVRRMFEAIGYRVLKLDRIEYAGIRAGIKRGACRKLRPSEIKDLKE